MLIIIDSTTKQIITNMGTNSLFPDGNIPNIEVEDGQELVKIHDESPLVENILNAHQYELIFNNDNEVIDVNVIKTLEQYRAELPIEHTPLTLEEKVSLMQQALDELLLGGM